MDLTKIESIIGSTSGNDYDKINDNMFIVNITDSDKVKEGLQDEFDVTLIPMEANNDYPFGRCAIICEESENCELPDLKNCVETLIPESDVKISPDQQELTIDISEVDPNTQKVLNEFITKSNSKIKISKRNGCMIIK